MVASSNDTANACEAPAGYGLNKSPGRDKINASIDPRHNHLFRTLTSLYKAGLGLEEDYIGNYG